MTTGGQQTGRADQRPRHRDPTGPVEVGGVPVGRVDRDAAAEEVLGRLTAARSGLNRADVRGQAGRWLAATGIIAHPTVRGEQAGDLTTRVLARCMPLLDREVPERVRAWTTPAAVAGRRAAWRTLPAEAAGRRGTVPQVRIAVLLFTQTTIDKLAAHGITPEEVRQVSDGDRIVVRNPRPRVAGSVLMIGPTYGGRVLTVVLNPDPLDPDSWEVRTGWLASAAQVGRYRHDRGRGTM